MPTLNHKKVEEIVRVFTQSTPDEFFQALVLFSYHVCSCGCIPLKIREMCDDILNTMEKCEHEQSH